MGCVSHRSGDVLLRSAKTGCAPPVRVSGIARITSSLISLANLILTTRATTFLPLCNRQKRASLVGTVAVHCFIVRRPRNTPIERPIHPSFHTSDHPQPCRPLNSGPRPCDTSAGPRTRSPLFSTPLSSARLVLSALSPYRLSVATLAMLTPRRFRFHIPVRFAYMCIET